MGAQRLVFIFFFFIGCEQISKHDDLKFSGCGLKTDLTECQDCFDKNCCSEGVACADDEECLNLAECQNACQAGDNNCVNVCRSVAPAESIATLDAAMICRDQTCVGVCEGSGVTGNQCGLVTSPPQCQECLEVQCCVEAQSCANNPQCVELAKCVGTCASGDQNCYQTCATTYAAGEGALTVISSCLDTRCAVPCSRGTTPQDTQEGDTDTNRGTGQADIAETDTSIPTSADTDVCGLLYSSDPVCEACFQNNCCTVGETCAANSECTALLDCLGRCEDDTSCVDACGEAHPNGVDDILALADCGTSNCDSVCSVEQEPDDCGMVLETEACRTCFNTNCCQEGLTCANNPVCVDMIDCANICALGDDSCLEQCVTLYGDGLEDMLNMSTCITTNCTAVCS